MRGLSKGEDEYRRVNKGGATTKKSELVRKTFGTLLVVVMLGALFGGLPILPGEAQVSPATICVSDEYKTIQAAEVKANSSDISYPVDSDADGYPLTQPFENCEIDIYPAIYVLSTIKVLMDDGSVETMNLDEYVKGVVAAEMSSGWPIEALRAQAVAARTFAVENTHHDHCSVDVCTDHSCCQAWNGPPYDAAIVDSVTSTCNEVITYNSTIIREALYFSHCHGHTRNSEDYDGWHFVPYLRGVFCSCADTYGWTDYGGHGVGMCQYGAKVMAEQGFSYVGILKHYYTGVAIASMNATGSRIVARLCGPAELRAYDSHERVTGLVDGDVRNEIPHSDYRDKTLTISPPSGSYRYEIAGVAEGIYELVVVSVADDEATIFAATDIPVASGAVHLYSIDWDALAREEKGVTVQVDEDGDSIIDYTVTAGSPLTGDQLVLAAAGISPGCFIATAAYGTPMAEEIETLREFRDEYLLTNAVGPAFVDFYYKVSPPMAEFITEHPSLKPIVRAGLVPGVAMSVVAVNTTLTEKMAMVALLVLVALAVAAWATGRRGRGPAHTSG